MSITIYEYVKEMNKKSLIAQIPRLKFVAVVRRQMCLTVRYHTLPFKFP